LEVRVRFLHPVARGVGLLPEPLRSCPPKTTPKGRTVPAALKSHAKGLVFQGRVVYAGVIGGCTIGIRKMALISHPISESDLENAAIGSSRWITSTPLAIACCSSWIDSNCRSSCSARRVAPTPRAMTRSLKCASILSMPTTQILRQGTRRQRLHFSRRARSVGTLCVQRRGSHPLLKR
jgi:hypothetical protein